MFLGQVLLDQGKASEADAVYQAILDSTGEADAYLGLIRVAITRPGCDRTHCDSEPCGWLAIRIEELIPLVVSITTNDEFAKNSVSICQTMYDEKPGDLHAMVPYFCSLIAEALKLPKEESALLKAAVELNPDRDLLKRVLEKYGLSQLTLGEYAMAAKIFEQLLAVPGLDPGVRVNTLFRISVPMLRSKISMQRDRLCRRHCGMVPNEPQLLARLAMVEASMGSLRSPKKLLEKSSQSTSG